VKRAAVLLWLACAKPDDGLHGIRTAIAAMKSDTLEGLPQGFTWTRLEEGVYVNYLGVPKGPGRSRWLVLILKGPSEPHVNDNEHQSLPDGTVLHVSVWSQPDAGPLPVVAVPFPEVDGWTKR
jgi:hypothetical protein